MNSETYFTFSRITVSSLVSATPTDRVESDIRKKDRSKKVRLEGKHSINMCPSQKNFIDYHTKIVNQVEENNNRMLDIAEKHHQDMASGMTYFAIAALVGFFIILLIFFYYKYVVSKKKKAGSHDESNNNSS